MTAPGKSIPAELGLRVRVLGGFVVEGREERGLGTRKARLLLRRLAVAGGRPVRGEELAAAVWGEKQPRNPADQVSVLVSRLRSVLGADRIPRSDAVYSLAADWLDLVDLEQVVVELEQRLRAGETSAALAAARSAMSLAAGLLLPEDDSEWIDEARRAADRLVARSRLLAAEAALVGGELGAARAVAQSVLDDDPYDEAALRIVMRADALAGRSGSELAAYAAVRHRLSDDLGADPAPETEQLHTAIVRGELPTISEAVVPSSPIVGRDSELSLLDGLSAQVATGSSAAVVIEAEAGMGKTALLAAWAGRINPGALVITGRCDELGGDLPLQPVVDGLVAHLDGLGREASIELLGDDDAQLAPLLGRRSGESSSRVTTVFDIDAGRTVLFGALAAVLYRAAGERLLVIAVDDLHQAAPGTAEFLSYVLRRTPHVMVVATRRPEAGPDLPMARRITLGPLSVSDAVVLVGPARGESLHERSGGHPLFLRELSAATDDQMPHSIVAAVRDQVTRLGDAGGSVEIAALCGTDIDAALIASVSARPVSAVLDDIELAARAGLLCPRGAALAFSHKLVREAIEAGTSPPRRVEIHRAALVELARCPETDPLGMARHARAGGDRALAAQALLAAAERARERFEADSAENLLEEAISLVDSAPARLARGRLRLARLDLDSAREDAGRAIDLGAGVEGFELAGWVAYYGRDYDTALRYAEEGVDRATEADLRASCLALAGRIRHTRGDLAGASVRLEEGVATAPPEIRGVVQVWYGQLLAHQGDTDQAGDIAQRALLDPHLAHPFAWGHGWFTLAYARGLSGQWSAALEAVDQLDELVARSGDKRFPPVAANMRGWLLRGAGQLELSMELHTEAAESSPGPTFQEARYAGLLDLAECHLASGRLDEAAAAVESAQGVLEWTGSMSWRHRNRYRLLSDRLASLSGDHAGALEDAEALAAEASERGDRRYQHRALIVAQAIEARVGRPANPEKIGTLIREFLPLAGPDGWRDLAELASAAGSEGIWRQAEAQAAAIVEQAPAYPGVDGAQVAKAVRSELDRLRP